MVQKFKIYEELTNELIRGEKNHMIVLGKIGGFSIYYSHRLKKYVCFNALEQIKHVACHIFYNLTEAKNFIERHGCNNPNGDNIQFKYRTDTPKVKQGELFYTIDPIFDGGKNDQLKRLLLLLI